ncbi:MAG: asparagine synthase (glutamine-hydrolyzing) [Chlamydiales bacterium]
MCGITGIVENHPLNHDRKNLLNSSCEKIRHRGPDQQGIFCEKKVGLGSRRLAIRDKEKGHQPFQYKYYVIVFNGELYDFQSLKKELLARGYQIRTSCDTEIFLYAFIEFGIEYLKKINGMFAFGIWDKKEEKLTLGRDRWGEKPLYYTHQNGALAFASEIAALKVWPHIEWEPSIPQLHFFLKHSYLCGKTTGWENVSKLDPGSVLTWHKNRTKTHTYFSPHLTEKNTPLKELPQKIEESVKNCLISDRPVGTFLSGGIDSAIITHFAANHQPNLKTFSLDWEENNYSEKEAIIETAHSLGVQNYRTFCTPEFFKKHFDSLVQICGEPFADESLFPCYCLSLFAKQHVDVVLTGDGADELFHGYERYYSYNGPIESYLDIFSATPEKVFSQIVHSRDQINMPFLPKNTSLREKSLLDMRTYLPHDILTKIDRATMGASLEARAPFLTQEISSIALSLPPNALYDDEYLGKKALKKAMSGLLPDKILMRKKRGFGMPLEEWFRTPLKEWVQIRLTEGNLPHVNWIDMEGVKRVLQDHIKRKINASRPLLNLLVLNSWLTQR